MLVWNKDARPAAYEHLKDLYRPSHTLISRTKRSTASEIGRVVEGRVLAKPSDASQAGAIAKQILRENAETEVFAYVKQIHTLTAEVDTDTVTLEQIEDSPVRCPDPIAGPKMAETH